MTDNEKELMPCPFCGGEAEFERIGNTRMSTIVSCTDCGCRLECGETFNHGEQWNARPQPSTDKPCETCNGDDLKNIIDAYEGLIIYNLWRRGSDLVEDQPDPKTLGIWIETAIKVMRQTITQPKAVDVEALKKDRNYYDYKSHQEREAKGWNDCIDNLHTQGYLNTKERVKELEERLEIDHTGYDGIETRNESIRLQDRAIDELSQKLKVATEALKYIRKQGFGYTYIHETLQQIEGNK